MEHLYVIGIDYGTDSVRALLADAESGEEIAVAVCNYSRWGRGLYCDTAKSQFRQHPLDYLEGLEQVLRQVIAQCPAPGGDTRHRRGYDRQHAVSGRSHLHAAIADGGL